MKKVLLLSLSTMFIAAMLSGCGDEKNKEEGISSDVSIEKTDVEDTKETEDKAEIGDTTDDTQDNDDYNLAETGAWETNTCHNDKYMVTVNSKTAGHPDGAAMSLNYYYKERAIGDFVEEMDISVRIHFCQDSLLDIHPDYMDYAPVNCFGRDGYYKEIQDEDFIEFLSEREINMGRFDGRSGIAIFYPCYDDMYLVAVIEYFFPFIYDPNDAMAYYYVQDGFIYDENDNICVEYEAFDLKKLFNDPEFLEFDVIEVSEM